MQGLGVVVLGMVTALAIPAVTDDEGWRVYASYYPVMALAIRVVPKAADPVFACPARL